MLIKLSIVTINLNMKNGLEDSIRSLISQDLSDEIEFIVVDGQSSDGSLDIIYKYEDYIDQVIVEKDTGIFDAMNKGVNLAKGEYIYFLNSGDVFSSNTVLRKLINIIRETKGSHSIFYGKVATFMSGQFVGIADHSPWLAHQGVFIKSELMKEYMFDTNYSILGDLDLWKRLKRDGFFYPFRINVTIANLELDGIGSDPSKLCIKIKDKYYSAKKFNEYFNFAGSFVLNVSRFLVYKFFGSNFYHNKFSKVISFIKTK